MFRRSRNVISNEEMWVWLELKNLSGALKKLAISLKYIGFLFQTQLTIGQSLTTATLNSLAHHCELAWFFFVSLTHLFLLNNFHKKIDGKFGYCFINSSQIRKVKTGSNYAGISMVFLSARLATASASISPFVRPSVCFLTPNLNFIT